MAFLKAVKILKEAYEKEKGRVPKYLVLNETHHDLLKGEIDGPKALDGVVLQRVLDMEVILLPKYIGSDFRWGFGE